MKYSFLLLLLSSLIYTNCTTSGKMTAVSGIEKVNDFDQYWYQSKAEITSYKLEQSRYGEIHPGYATTIFVTEPFNTNKQVKADNGAADETVSVLKLNKTRKFNTGIYPYSTMTSTFTPVNISGPGATLKVSNSVQEWCGQVYMQMNKKSSHYQVQSYSYFESEGDNKFKVNATLLEDEIMNLIRINPNGIEEGKATIIPSSTYLRFLHKPLKPYNATIEKSSTEFNGKQVQLISINYSELSRTLTNRASIYL